MEHKQYNIDDKIEFHPIDNPKQDFFSSLTEVQTQKNFKVKSTAIFNEKEANLLKGQRSSVTRINQADSALYTMQTADYLLSILDVGVARTISLPLPGNVGIGKLYVIKDASGSAASTTITIIPLGASENAIRIDGDTSNVINNNFGVRKFYSDGGSNWFTTN